MNGLLLVDKPGGMTSHDVVARVRRLTGERQIGHLGTLDPMATGLLPLLLGKWTRLAQFYGALPKSYTGTIRLGWATDTYDADGAPTGECVRPLVTLEQLRALAAEQLGEHLQAPPVYSAKKIGGKPAYARARAGETPEMRPVPITLDSFEIESLMPGPKASPEVSPEASPQSSPEQGPDGSRHRSLDAVFAMRISSGGYVRAAAHTLGQRAGCGAHLAALRRVAAGPLRLSDALSLEQIESLVQASERPGMPANALEQALPHPRQVLTNLPAVTADAATLRHLRNGMQVALPEFSQARLVRVFAQQRELAAVAERVAGVLFQPRVVLL